MTIPSLAAGDLPMWIRAYRRDQGVILYDSTRGNSEIRSPELDFLVTPQELLPVAPCDSARRATHTDALRLPSVDRGGRALLPPPPATARVAIHQRNLTLSGPLRSPSEDFSSPVQPCRPCRSRHEDAMDSGAGASAAQLMMVATFLVGLA